MLLSHTGKISDKWSSYIEIYDKLYADFQDQTINILEIGVQNGGALEVAAKYFSAAKNIVGVDINEDCAKLRFDDSRVAVVVGDATSAETEKKIAKIAKSYDIILDDGSHTSPDIIKAFFRYFPRLAEGGIFVIEDLHCSYWADFEGGLQHPFSAINFLKLLVDNINHEHWGTDNERTELIHYIAERFAIEISEAELAKIHSISFLNSVCIIQKKRQVYNTLGTRLSLGTLDEVVSKNRLKSKLSRDQFHNQYSKINSSPIIEQLALQNLELDNLKLALSKKNEQLKLKDDVIADKESEIYKRTLLVNQLRSELLTIQSGRIFRCLKVLNAILVRIRF